MTAPKRLSVKLFISNPDVVEVESLVPVFQEWIQRDAIKDELLIDVVDYKHVHHGPGIILIGYEGDYGYDSSAGQVGLQYTYKQIKADSLADAVSVAIQRLITAAGVAENEAALNGLKIDTSVIELKLLDRLNYPNTEETASAVQEVLTPVAESISGDGFSLTVKSDNPREPLTIVLEGESIPANASL